ncbi:MAG: MFS transporter, partial [Clostridiales bacterium]|nr:MFS transporter [Clostridiales bacterium]
FYNDSVTVSAERRLLTFAVYVVLIIEILILIYALIKLIKALKGFVLDESVKTQLIMLVTALAVTVGISYIIFDSFNARYTSESSSNLCNIAYLISETIDKDELKEIYNPDSYFTETYENIDESIQSVLQSDINAEGNVYCVVYKTLNDVVCEIYRYDMGHSVMYPMAGRYSGAIEERIAAENSYDVVYDFALSEGTYMYALIPVYYENGETAAFIEAGADYTAFTSSSRELYIRVLMLAAMAVIIIMLLLSEFLCSINAFKADREARRKKAVKPPDVIRPIAFIFFVIANLSTAFLPIYGMHLWTEDFPFAAEFAAAFPLSAELIMAAVAAFLCGFIIRKAGVKVICAVGGMFYILGCLASAFAPNLWVLILANATCGTGSGCLSLALNTWAASYEDEEKQNRGFIHINAAYLAGLNCGTVIGSLIWENLGIKMVYFMGAAAAAVLIILSFVMINKIEVSDDKEEKDSAGNIKELLSPSVIRYFICISVPYMICSAFLEYFFPIEAENAGLTAVYISMAFLISGMISIYTGSSMAEIINAKLGIKKAMILASFIYAAALIYLVINPVIFSYYIVIGLFAAANSFGLSAQAVYFSSMPQVRKAGQSRALGVNSTVESITSACGSIIFGAVLTLGVQKGILIIAVVLALLLMIFAFSEKNTANTYDSEVSGSEGL